MHLIILVVDDDREHARAIVERLRLDGHDVHPAGDELNARWLARNQKLDAAIVCLRPDSGSVELARDLRANLLLPSSPLIAIDPGDGHREAVDTRAFDVVLQQPLDLAQLSGLLHHLGFLRRVPDSSNQG